MQTPKKEIRLTPAQARTLAELYQAMETPYAAIAAEIGLTCAGCPDNCCDSYFLHYTYAEWAYLWAGLRDLEPALLTRIEDRARHYLAASAPLLARDERPRLMCPLNEAGRCVLYSHRLMICRLHGVPAAMTRPDGRRLLFPGCFRCQEIVAAKYAGPGAPPCMDRTGLLTAIAALEGELLDGRRHLYPKVRRTIAEMIVAGPPLVDKPFCAR